jgi:hypothetical protein
VLAGPLEEQEGEAVILGTVLGEILVASVRLFVVRNRAGRRDRIRGGVDCEACSFVGSDEQPARIARTMTTPGISLKIQPDLLCFSKYAKNIEIRASPVKVFFNEW